MSNATDTYDRIKQGFDDLLQLLRSGDERQDSSKRIKANTKAREAAGKRVWSEFAELGIAPPSDLALSITARSELGYQLPAQPAGEEAAE